MLAGLEAVVRSSGALEFGSALAAGDLQEGPMPVAADVLLVELPGLDEDWMGTLTEIAIPSVVLTDMSEPAALAAGLRSGVRAVLSKDASSAEIVAAICAAAAGLITMQIDAFEMLAADQRPAPAELEEPLSRREIEVLGMLAEGLSNKLVAHRLGISNIRSSFM